MASRLTKLLVLIMALIELTACHAGEPWVEIEGQRIHVEVADDDRSRARGLMFREELGDDRGMLFIFRQQRPRSFWMKNTRIALDIIYLDRELSVVSIAADTPPCPRLARRCPSYPSEGPAQYVLEINAGRAAELGLEPGDRIEAGNVAQSDAETSGR